jgi:hypothetical protein
MKRILKALVIGLSLIMGTVSGALAQDFRFQERSHKAFRGFWRRIRKVTMRQYCVNGVCDRSPRNSNDMSVPFQSKCRLIESQKCRFGNP